MVQLKWAWKFVRRGSSKIQFFYRKSLVPTKFGMNAPKDVNQILGNSFMRGKKSGSGVPANL